jgi:hypothetical protein
MIDQRAHRLGGVALAPVAGAEPVADLRRGAVAHVEAAAPDHGAIRQRDEIGLAFHVGTRADDPALGVGHPIGMRDAGGVLRDAQVIRERRNRFGVPELRRTQNQPLGLEDGE